MKKVQKKIKILYTIPNFNTAGSGLAVLSLAQKLNRKYFEPEIATLHGEGKLFSEVKASGIKYHLIELYRDARPIKTMLKSCWELSRILKKINPDIIHSYHYSSDYTEALASRMAGIPWVYTKKNMGWRGPSYRSWLLRSFLANGIISQNSDMNKIMFPRWKKVRKIPIGVNVSEFSSNSISQKLGTKRILISVANLVKVKGIDLLIRAFSKIHEELKDWQLIIIGNTNTVYGANCVSLVQRLGITDKVIFTGKVSSVKPYLDKAELFILPSRGSGEGGPIAILEAMAASKNIIASKVPGNKDILSSFPEHLFNPDSIKDLTEKLYQYLSLSVDQNIEQGKLFLTYVRRNYDIYNEVKNIQKFYQIII